MQSATPPELQSLVRNTYSALMKAHGGVPRRGQQQMIGAIATAVACSKKIGKEGTGERILAVNAPTGSGKSFSYGVGAIPVALANGLRVVISTSNVALQTQLMERDLVSLAAVVPQMSVASVKGRSRYACPQKMARAVAEGGNEEVAELLVVQRGHRVHLLAGRGQRLQHAGQPGQLAPLMGRYRVRKILPDRFVAQVYLIPCGLDDRVHVQSPSG